MTIPQLIQRLTSLPPSQGEESLRTICKQEEILHEMISEGTRGKLHYVARQHDYLLVLVGRADIEGQYFLWRTKRHILSLCQRLDIPVEHIFTMIINTDPDYHPNRISKNIDYIIC